MLLLYCIYGACTEQCPHSGFSRCPHLRGVDLYITSAMLSILGEQERGGGETQQELIPFKHKGWSVVDLVLSELTVTEMGAWR